MAVEQDTKLNNKHTLRKVLFNGAVLAVLMGLTAYLVFSKQELSDIVAYISEANPWWLLGGALLLLVFVTCESLIMYYLFRRLECRAKFRHCITYSYVGFFISAITPSASGGQPVQLIWMRRDGLDVGIASLVLLVITLAYKLALILLSVVLFIFNYGFVMANLGFMLYVFILGFALNVAFCALLAVVIFRPATARKSSMWILNLLCKIKLLRNRASLEERLERVIDRYSQGTDRLIKFKSLLAEVFAISVFQRFIFFVITYMVYRALGAPGSAGFFEIIALQVVLSAALDMLPFPGGMGANEGGFMVMYASVFGSALVVPGMLLSRGINYYLLVLVGAAVTMVSYILGQRKIKNLKK